MVIMLALQALARYVLEIGIPWTEEISRFSFIFFVYISASLAMMRGTHIKVEFLLMRLPVSVRKIVVTVGNMAQIVFFTSAGIAGLLLVRQMIAFPVYSAALIIPLHYIYVIIPIAYFLMAIRLLQRTLFPAAAA